MAVLVPARIEATFVPPAVFCRHRHCISGGAWGIIGGDESADDTAHALQTEGTVDKESLKIFREALVKLRQRLASNVNHMQTEALRDSGGTTAELSDLPLEHLADRGSDNFARDLMISILQSSEAELCDIDLALDKIDKGTFGICEVCGKPVSKTRLKALPFARLCIRCKQTEEGRRAAAK